mmetsp:Transcript_11933/g.20132  ORF Transcript_11933/g.20132 Transcript_11933/m.20132 type:complete len:254 (+) Transcript_11933:3-764(+)
MRGLVFLHTPEGGKPVHLHRDVKPSNILLDAHLNAMLADVGLAKAAGTHEHTSTNRMLGTQGFVDPLFINGGKHSVLNDGFAAGITMLIALTGFPALNIKARCRRLLCNTDHSNNRQTQSVTDASAGEWPDTVVCGIAKLAAGLTEEYEEDRGMVPEALRQLEALLAMHGDGGMMAGSDSGDLAEGPRLCMICEELPREVRFNCGHACCCSSCVDRIQQRDNLCPACRAPLGTHPFAERGEHIRNTSTYVEPL